jgi:hypothetical protein
MSIPSGKLSTQRQPLAEQSAAREAAAERPAVPLTEVDRDLARLEASLQWIQRQGRRAARMPRAAQLPLVSGLRPVSPQDLRSRDEQFINGARVPPPLAPERLLPPPMRERRDNLRGPAGLLLASVIAAPIAYYFSVGNFSSNTESGRGSGLTSLASRLVASTEFSLPKEELALSEAEDYNTMVSFRNKLAVLSTPATKVAPARIEPPAREPAAIPRPSPAAEQSAPAPKPDVEVAKVTADTGAAVDRPDVKTTADKLEIEGVEPPGQNPNRDMAGGLSTIATVRPTTPTDTTEQGEPPGKLEGAVVPSIAPVPSRATGAAGVAGNAGDRRDTRSDPSRDPGVEPPDQHRTPTPRPRPSVNLSLREGDVPAPAKAVTCQTSGPAGDGHWAWRLIDGRKCWYKGAAGMDKSLLHWPPLEHVPELQ